MSTDTDWKVDDPARLGQAVTVYLAQKDGTGGDWYCYETRAQAERQANSPSHLKAGWAVWETTKTYSRYWCEEFTFRGTFYPAGWSYYWGVDRAGARRLTTAE